MKEDFDSDFVELVYSLNYLIWAIDRSRRKKMGKELLAFVVMVIVQLGFAGMIIISKLVMDGGMNPFVQSAYRPIFATISIAPFAFYFERYLMFES